MILYCFKRQLLSQRLKVKYTGWTSKKNKMDIRRLSPQRFSEYFLLPKNLDFDFLEIYAEHDIEFFLDSYGIAAEVLPRPIARETRKN